MSILTNIVPTIGVLRPFSAVLAAAAIVSLPASNAGAAEPPVLQAAAASPWSLDASIDGVFAKRGQSNATIVEDITGAPLIGGHQLGFDRKWGLDGRLRVGYEAWSVEARYFGGLKWRSGHSTPTPPTYVLPTTPPAFANGFNQADVRDDSRLDSWEGNLRWRASSNLVVFAGYRWMKLSDTLALNVVSPGGGATIAWDSSLRSRGPQIGAELRVFGPDTPFNPLERVFLDLDARVGWLRTSGTQTFSIVQPNLGPSFNAAGTFAKTSVAYELGAALGVRVAPNVEVRAGYRYLHLGSTVMAPDLIAVTDPLNETIHPVARSVAIHGATLGVRVLVP